MRTLKLFGLVTLAVVLLFGALSVWVLVAGDSEEPAPAPVATAPPTPEAPVAWAGNTSQNLNTSFFYAGKQITIQKIVYRKLNRRFGNVVVVASVVAPGRDTPEWLLSAFSLRSSNATRASEPVRSSRTGRVVRVQVPFARVPSQQLLEKRVALQVRYPRTEGGTFSGFDSFLVGLLPERPTA